MPPQEGFILSNLRLAELVAIVNANRPIFDDFVDYLREAGYPMILAFIAEETNEKAISVIDGFLGRNTKVILYDGVGRPYDNALARWYFLAWLLRDAPAQRLRPLLNGMPGRNIQAKRANLLNEVRKFVGPLFPTNDSWSWAAVSEVMLARLEGSRRSLKGTLFEAIVRRSLKAVIEESGINLTISTNEVRILDESYDVQVSGPTRSILIPIKTRETMGGGHAILFTRDIHKAISVAEGNGYQCLPVVIAESWGGDLKSLTCENYIYLKINPNQVIILEPLLADRFRELIPLFRNLADH